MTTTTTTVCYATLVEFSCRKFPILLSYRTLLLDDSIIKRRRVVNSNAGVDPAGPTLLDGTVRGSEGKHTKEKRSRRERKKDGEKQQKTKGDKETTVKEKKRKKEGGV